jgi:N-ethylmaleimide reductase
VIHHFRNRYKGSLIVNVGLNADHGARLISEGAADLVAFGRDYIANPDLVERITASAPLNPIRPEHYYGSSPVGYTDYPFLHQYSRKPRPESPRGSRLGFGDLAGAKKTATE